MLFAINYLCQPGITRSLPVAFIPPSLIMFSRSLQLVCSILIFCLCQSVSAQLSTATANGIISAAGAPQATQSISYSIEGEPATALATSTGLTLPTHSSGSDASPLSGNNSNLANSDQHRLSTGAIVGITLAVILAVVGIIGGVIVMHKRKRQTARTQRRKSILAMEFAGESKANLQQMETNQSANTTIGFFDVAKPLPAVVVEPESEKNRLSRSSTIIGDAAEVAQINRKASSHHNRRQKAARDAVRERNHALQILITNEDNRTSVVPNSPLMSNPTTPVDDSPNPQGNNCTDGDGDTFAKRPSKI